MSKDDIERHLRHNLIVNILDGGFFGLGLGFASFVTILPLFVSKMTDSAILIGLIPAIHNIGWQLPQLLTVGSVTRLQRYKPMVILMTLHERLPFIGLAVVAWFLPIWGAGITLPLTFGLLVWQGMGGGFTATAWQSMIGKIIPTKHRGSFFGMQAAAANLFASVGALVAGLLLEQLNSRVGFVACFLLAAVAMSISWGFLAKTKESPSSLTSNDWSRNNLWRGIVAILNRDTNFRWFLVARMLSQLAVGVVAFFVVYVVRRFGITETTAGFMTGVFLMIQIASNPLMGWVSDRCSRRFVLQIGAIASATSAFLAWWAPTVTWFYLVFVLAGIANVAFWSIALAMTLEFGTEAERPAYIGLTNTLIAPSALIGPIIVGLLADAAGFQAAFLAAAFCGLLTALVLRINVRDSQDKTSTVPGQCDVHKTLPHQLDASEL